MANIGVNVPVAEVVGYMGALYAENIVLGDWMHDLDNLCVAESRAWIYQVVAHPTVYSPLRWAHSSFCCSHLAALWLPRRCPSANWTRRRWEGYSSSCGSGGTLWIKFRSWAEEVQEVAIITCGATILRMSPWPRPTC